MIEALQGTRVDVLIANAGVGWHGSFAEQPDDGIVQHAGISPYAHTPQSTALSGLRPDWLFPDKIDGTCDPLQPRYRGLGDGGTVGVSRSKSNG
ncbi:hypothetical protein IAE22_30840 [Bacillus sp. S34]|nr:hypothetical protein [Bacillus sp. S34]